MNASTNNNESPNSSAELKYCFVLKGHGMDINLVYGQRQEEEKILKSSEGKAFFF
jgi:hypothetical protein